MKPKIFITIILSIIYLASTLHYIPLPTGEGLGVRLPLPLGGAGGGFVGLLFHANIFHLLGNLFVLWMLQLDRNHTPHEGTNRIIEGCIIAVLCPFLPSFHIDLPNFQLSTINSQLTLGFSGAIFAIVGAMWGEAFRKRPTKKTTSLFVTRCLPWAVVGIFIPHVDGMLHTYCLFAGLLYKLLPNHLLRNF